MLDVAMEMGVATLVWCFVLVAGTPAQTSTPGGLAPTQMGPQQDLQTVLNSLDERLKALDLTFYTIRCGGRWDQETSRRLENIETRTGRLDTLIDIRTEKLLEATSSTSRRIDSVYDRINHRLAYTENKLDLALVKIQSSIESGLDKFAQLRTSLQKQLDDFERSQNQTVSRLHEMLAKRPAASVLNDEQGIDRDSFRRGMDRLSTSVENIASKVNKISNDFIYQSQSLEALAKNSMSLTNATRREVQEGFKTLGHRKIVLQQGSKQTKEKEAAASLEGWDALSNLLSKEFGNLVRKIDSNYEELSKDHNLFIDGCHRIQENESQLEAEIAGVLERILDMVQNRSHVMEKQVVALQESLKTLKTQNNNVIRTISHSTNMALQSTQYTKQLEATVLEAVGKHRGLEQVGEGIASVLAGIKALQNRVETIPTPSVVSENSEGTCSRSCPDSRAIAESILTAILNQNFTMLIESIDNDANIHKIAEKIAATLRCTQATVVGTRPGSRDEPVASNKSSIQGVVERTIERYQNDSRMPNHKGHDDYSENAENKKNADETESLGKSQAESEEEIRASEAVNDDVSVLDIPVIDDHIGDVMEYNVTSEQTPIPPPSFMNTKSAVDEDDEEESVNKSQETQESKLNVHKDDQEKEVESETKKEEESEKGNVMDLDEDDLEEDQSLGMESSTEATIDYDLEKTSVDNDKSDPSYYDDLQEGAFDDDQTLKNYNRTNEPRPKENNDLETRVPTVPHRHNSNRGIPPEDLWVRPIKSETVLEPEDTSHLHAVSDANIDNLIEEKEKIENKSNLAHDLNENLKRVKNIKAESESDEKLFQTDKRESYLIKIDQSTTDDLSNLHNETNGLQTMEQLKKGIAYTSIQKTEDNSTDSPKTLPVFSSFWNRMVEEGAGNAEISSADTLPDLLVSGSSDHKTHVDSKGQKLNDNVNSQGVNVTALGVLDITDLKQELVAENGQQGQADRGATITDHVETVTELTENNEDDDYELLHVMPSR